MPKFNRAAALKGAEGINEAAERRGGGGNFRPFAPELQWREDGDEKYVLILTPIEEALGFNIHEWIPTGTFEKQNGETSKKYDWFMCRKDAAIGDDGCEICDRLDDNAKTRTFGVGVELEPVIEPGRGGRNKVVGFEVKTATYNKKGEDDESIEVTYPVIGVISQAAQNYWKTLVTHDEAQSDITETPFQIIRRGKGSDTDYDFIHFMEKPVDLSNLLDYIDGVSYLSSQEEFEGLIAEVEALDDDLEAAIKLADALLTVRLNELADEERFEELVPGVNYDDIRRWGDKGKGKGKKAEKSRPERATRTRRSRREEPADETPETEPEADTSSDEEAPKKSSPKKGKDGDRFAKLRARAEQAAA